MAWFFCYQTATTELFCCALLVAWLLHIFSSFLVTWEAFLKHSDARCELQYKTQGCGGKWSLGNASELFLNKQGLFCLLFPLYLFTPCHIIGIHTISVLFTWSLNLHDVLVQILTLLHHFVSHIVHGCLSLCMPFQPLLCQADVLCTARGGAASPAAAATAAAWAAGVIQLTS